MNGKIKYALLILMSAFYSCSVGTILPVYSTFKAIESKDENEKQKWLVYWAGSSFLEYPILFCLPNKLV